MKSEVGALASQGIRLPLSSLSIGLSAGEGPTFMMNSMSRFTPMFLSPERQNTGYTPWVAMPLARPARISSSVSIPFSKKSSMRPSSFSAAASVSLALSSLAFSSWSAGISSSSRSPLVPLKRYIFMSSTSMKVSKFAPGFTGYCTVTTLLPNDWWSVSRVWS